MSNYEEEGVQLVDTFKSIGVSVSHRIFTELAKELFGYVLTDPYTMYLPSIALLKQFDSGSLPLCKTVLYEALDDEIGLDEHWWSDFPDVFIMAQPGRDNWYGAMHLDEPYWLEEA